MIKSMENQMLDAFKSLLHDQRYGSQQQLANALSAQGFGHVTQTRVSRLLVRVGAVKVRNHNNAAVYRLPAKQHVPRVKQAIDSVVLEIKHNGAHIIVKTVIGGATIISKVIESIGESHGILGCMASDNMVLVIPTHVSLIEDIVITIRQQLGLESA